MRFLCIYRPNKTEGAGPTQQEMETMGRFIQGSFEEGYLISTEGCLPTSFGARVRRNGDHFTVTDGPFTEAKEVVGGFAIIRAESKHQAIEYTKRFLNIAGDGETELRQLCEAPAGAAEEGR